MNEDVEGVEYLSTADLLMLADRMGVGPVRDLGLLDSAAHRPRSGFMGREVYPTPAAKAAALLHSVCCNHALVDGNKRLALLAMTVFLRVNGLTLDLDDDAAFDLVMDVAKGECDVPAILARLRLAPA